MEEMLAQIKEIITKENEKLRKSLEANFEQKLENLRLETKQEMQEIKDCLFVLEHEHGKKIDAIYDALMIQQEKNDNMLDNIDGLDKRTERNEISIFDHEKRISVLEKVNL